MRRILALLLALSMVFAFAACGKSEPSVVSSVSEVVSVPQETPAPTPEPTPEPAPEPEPEPSVVEEPVVVEETVEETDPIYINPLTGEVTETDISRYRPYTAMLNTIEQALPQSANSKADMLIEITEEGGITRVMGVYQDLTDVGTIGTIRSTREYFLALTMGMDALMIHAGGSKTAKAMLKDYDYTTINFMTNGGPFWRDQWRVDNVGTEHSLYTSSEKIHQFVADNSLRYLHEEGFTQPFRFTEDGTPVNGQSGVDISASFSGYKTTRFVYNETTGLYDVYAYGDPYMDESTDTQVAVTNVVIIPTEQTALGYDGLQRFDLSEGTGYFACGGKYVPIRWQKGEDEDPLKLFNSDGSDLQLGVGKTYICILGDTRPVNFQ